VVEGSPALFSVARNPDAASSLPFLLRLPIEGGVVLKAKQPWPTSTRVYCHREEKPWPLDPELVEEVPVRHCARRGSAIDLVLDRPTRVRSQFVFTEIRGRVAIFWQTAKAARSARPGVRVPARRAAGLSSLRIEVDTRERYPYRFAGRPVERPRVALPAGDYAVRDGDRVVAAVERKTLENFATSAVDGSIGLQMTELATLEAAAVVIEGRYSDLFKLDHVEAGFVPELVARLQVRHPGVPIVFAESRKLAEEWTYRFLARASVELGRGA